MKKHFIIFILCFLSLYSLSCKKNDSFTSSSAADIGGIIYYYKLCYANNADYIVKYSCTNNNISSLIHNNVNKQCSTPLYYLSTGNIGIYSEEIKQSIIDPILEAKTFQIIDNDNEQFKMFDKSLERFGKAYSSEDFPTGLTCSPVGLEYKPWLATIQGSDVIYQNATNNVSIVNLQWSKLMKNSNNEDQMSYEEAKDACKNYNFKFSDWGLPDTESLNLALKEYRLASLLNLTDTKSAIWSSNGEAVSIEQNDDISQSEKNYTVCVRTYKKYK